MLQLLNLGGDSRLSLWRKMVHMRGTTIADDWPVGKWTIKLILLLLQST
jgi:hypothetical protein